MHLQGAGLHVGAPHVERDPDVELVRHGLPFHQAELANVVAVVGCVHDVGVVQLTSLHQHVVNLKRRRGGEDVGRAGGQGAPGLLSPKGAMCWGLRPVPPLLQVFAQLSPLYGAPGTHRGGPVASSPPVGLCLPSQHLFEDCVSLH